MAERISLALGVAVAFMFGQWGNLPVTVQILLVVMIMDVASGFILSIQNKKLSSAVAWKGVSKKAMALVVVALVHYLGAMTQIPFHVGELVAGFYIYTESISVIENATAAGLPIPQFLRDALAQLKPHDEPTAFDAKIKTYSVEVKSTTEKVSIPEAETKVG